MSCAHHEIPTFRSPTHTYSLTLATQILDTEKRYVIFLKLIVEYYVPKMVNEPRAEDAKKHRVVRNKSLITTLFSKVTQSSDTHQSSHPPGVIESQVAKVLFPPVLPELIALHEEFLVALEQRYSLYKYSDQFDELCIGDLFLEYSTRFKIYMEYLPQFKAAISLFKDISEKDTKLNDWILEQKPVTQNQDLPSLLTMPIQRLPRYILLLKAIYKHTPKNHPDYNNLREAEETVCEYCEKLNFKSLNLKQK